MMLGGNDTRHIPLGDSGAAALVVSVHFPRHDACADDGTLAGSLSVPHKGHMCLQVLYLAGAAAIILNWQKTGFHYYKALISSTACESPRPSPAAGCSMCQHTSRSSHN